MFYKVLYSKKALKSLKKMDNHNKLYILSWITKNLEGTDNPYEKGKTLKGNFKGSVIYDKSRDLSYLCWVMPYLSLP
jgi:mRNA interferase RelE/StbE